MYYISYLVEYADGTTNHYQTITHLHPIEWLARKAAEDGTVTTVLLYCMEVPGATVDYIRRKLGRDGITLEPVENP